MFRNKGSLTPINDFLAQYKSEGRARFHMPGHKGRGITLDIGDDITEVKGADYLYEASGIIGESEKIAAEFFGSERTLYSTEGSSLSIKTMVTLAVKYYYQRGGSRVPVIIAPRNSHKAFVDALVLTGADVSWVLPQEGGNLCTAFITAEQIEDAIKNQPDACAVYLTSPDYCGNLADIAAVSEVCRRYDLPLLVDNAHGAYLKFINKGLHPLEQGADICCDSAHKTLSVLTGGGYLHIAQSAPPFFAEHAKAVMSLFASTSPSYLILKPLDKANEGFNTLGERVLKTQKELDEAAIILRQKGFEVQQNEPLKLCIKPNLCGHSGDGFAEILRQNGVECEYSDGECVVLMASAASNSEDFLKLKRAFETVKPTRMRVEFAPFTLSEVRAVMSAKEAYFRPFESVEVEKSVGRICAYAVTHCQPSVPVCIGGEVISEEMVKILKRSSIFKINVLK